MFFIEINEPAEEQQPAPDVEGLGAHWAVKNPGKADQYRREAEAARVALGFSASSDDVSPREITDSIQAIKAGDSQSVLALVSALWRALNFIRGHGDFEHREALERCECYACVTGEIIDSLAAHRKHSLAAHRKQGGE